MASSAEQVVVSVAEDAGSLAVDLAELSGNVQDVSTLVRKQANDVADLRGASATITERWLASSRHRFGLYKWSLCRLMG
jgi:hypothetical protein